MLSNLNGNHRLEKLNTLEKSRNDDKNSVAVVSLLMKKCKFVLSLQSMPRANPTNYA